MPSVWNLYVRGLGPVIILAVASAILTSNICRFLYAFLRTFLPTTTIGVALFLILGIGAVATYTIESEEVEYGFVGVVFLYHASNYFFAWFAAPRC